ncbi:hypothetical protein [Glycomyces arizonensis]|uniref:hypothetical protein n=1 Tax=Glycomyces arizonensis TaxID=256035 RepID=UPI00040142D7|nr:hypothetical protein [Glycomyces arizonensis]
MTMSARRRKGFGRRLAAAAAAAGMTVLVAAGAAGAAAPDETPEQIPPSLPAVGETFDLPMAMEGLELTINGRTVTTGPLQGNVTFKIEENPDPLTPSVLATPAGFKLSGQVEPDGGTITIEQNDVAIDAKSVLKLTQQFPPRYEQVVSLPLSVTIDHPEASTAEQSEPLVLTTKEPGQLVGSLTQFPPRGDVYQLENPIDLALPDDPNTTIATIDKFPVKVGGI